MEFQNLIRASSMIREVLGNMLQDSTAEVDIVKSIEKLKADLSGFDNLIDD